MFLCWYTYLVHFTKTVPIYTSLKWEQKKTSLRYRDRDRSLELYNKTLIENNGWGGGGGASDCN